MGDVTFNRIGLNAIYNQHERDSLVQRIPTVFYSLAI